MRKRFKILCIFAILLGAISVESNDSMYNNVEYSVLYNADALASKEGGDLREECLGEGSLDCVADPESKYEYVSVAQSQALFFRNK